LFCSRTRLRRSTSVSLTTPTNPTSNCLLKLLIDIEKRDFFPFSTHKNNTISPSTNGISTSTSCHDTVLSFFLSFSFLNYLVYKYLRSSIFYFIFFFTSKICPILLLLFLPQSLLSSFLSDLKILFSSSFLLSFFPSCSPAPQLKSKQSTFTSPIFLFFSKLKTTKI